VIQLEIHNLRPDRVDTAILFLKSNPTLENLGIFFGNLGEKDIIKLLNALKDNNYLHSVHFVSCLLFRDGSSEIFKNYFSSRKKWKEVYLMDNNISDYSGQQLIPNLFSVEKLTISDNEISDDTCQHITRLLTADVLQYLDLSNNQITSIGVISLFSSLSNCHSLTYLNLSGNDIGNSGVKSLANCLSSLPLRILFVQNCSIATDGGIALLQQVAINKTLTSFSIKGNHLGGIASSYWINLFKQNTMLQQLCLSNTGVSNIGEFQNAIIQNETLSTLEIAENRLGDVGGNVMANILMNQNTLTCLDLRGNLLTDSSGFAIVKALNSRTVPLKMLDIRTNQFQQKGEIVSLLQKTVKTVVVDMGFKHDICDGIQEF